MDDYATTPRMILIPFPDWPTYSVHNLNLPAGGGVGDTNTRDAQTTRKTFSFLTSSVFPIPREGDNRLSPTLRVKQLQTLWIW